MSKKEYENSTSKKDWQELLTDASNRKSLVILIVANMFLQCSGIVTMVFFSGIIFDKAGTSLDPSIAMIVIILCQLTGSMLVPFFIEKCGRRVLMLISCIICSLCMVNIYLFYFIYIESYLNMLFIYFLNKYFIFIYIHIYFIFIYIFIYISYFCFQLILGFYFYLDYKKYEGIQSVPWLPLAMLITFFFSYDIGKVNETINIQRNVC